MDAKDFVTLILQDSKLSDKLLKELHNIAQEQNSYEYGLPVWNDATMAQMREAIARWVVTVPQESEKP